MLTFALLSLSIRVALLCSPLHLQETGYKEPEENVCVTEVMVMQQARPGRCAKRQALGRKQPRFLLLILTSHVSTLDVNFHIQECGRYTGASVETGGPLSNLFGFFNAFIPLFSAHFS